MGLPNVPSPELWIKLSMSLLCQPQLKPQLKEVQRPQLKEVRRPQLKEVPRPQLKEVERGAGRGPLLTSYLPIIRSSTTPLIMVTFL